MTHTQPTASPRRRDPQGTRDRLVRAALDLFTTQGYHGSTTPQIAARAGVAEGTIYRHFSSKQQLLNEIYRGALRVFADTIRESTGERACRERLEQIALGWREVALRNPAVVRLVFVSRIRGQLDQTSRESWTEFREEVEKIIASGKAAGQVRPGPVTFWADVWLQLMALMLERIANREWTPEQTAPAQLIESAWIAMGV